MNVYFRHNTKRGKEKKGYFLSVFERKSANWNLSPSLFTAEFRSVQVLMEHSCFKKQTLGATHLPKGQTRLLVWNGRVCALCGSSSAFPVTHATVLKRKTPCKPARLSQWLHQHLHTALESTWVRLGHSVPLIVRGFPSVGINTS